VETKSKRARERQRMIAQRRLLGGTRRDGDPPRIHLYHLARRPVDDIDELGDVGGQIFRVMEEFNGRSGEDGDVKVEDDDLGGESGDLRDERRLRAEDGTNAVQTGNANQPSEMEEKKRERGRGQRTNER
jgi:hypothetical protein